MLFRSDGVWLQPVSALAEAVGIDYLDLAAPNKSAGLSAEDAAARLARDGPNELSPPKERPEWVKVRAREADTARRTHLRGESEREVARSGLQQRSLIHGCFLMCFSVFVCSF